MRGHWGAIHPLQIRPDKVSAPLYSDPYDILIGSRPGTAIKDSWQLHLDIKARNYAFSTPDDWPFPTVTVDPVGRYNKRKEQPDWYAVISTVTWAIMFISTKELLRHPEEQLPGHGKYKAAPKECFISLRAFLDLLPEPVVEKDPRAKPPLH